MAPVKHASIEGGRPLSLESAWNRVSLCDLPQRAGWTLFPVIGRIIDKFDRGRPTHSFCIKGDRFIAMRFERTSLGFGRLFKFSQGVHPEPYVGRVFRTGRQQ